MTDKMPVVQLRDLHKYYRLPRETLWKERETVKAVKGVSLLIEKGRSYGIVGESGCGKSTLARCVMGLEKPTHGKVIFRGADINNIAHEDLRQLRRDFQMVFQDPFGSLDPRQKVLRIVGEPLEALENTNRSERRIRVSEALAAVGLKDSDLEKYPHEFSGGQRQRIAIARALITKPALIVADEPVSALDVSVQAQVLNLLKDLQEEFGVTYLLISHDLAVIKIVCDEVAVMHAGIVVESGPTDQIFSAPQHEYTKLLLNAVPQISL